MSDFAKAKKQDGFTYDINESKPSGKETPSRTRGVSEDINKFELPDLGKG